MPQTVLEGVPILGHVASQWLGTDGKVYAGPLQHTSRKINQDQSILNPQFSFE